MSTSATEAVRGNAGIVAKFQLGAGQATDYGPEIKAFKLSGEDADDSDVTFTEAASGGAEADSLTITAVQSTKTGSFWRFLWTNPNTEVAVIYAPNGNAVPTADKPHFLMTVRTGNRPDIGGEASRDKTRFDFETTMTVVSGPTLTTA